MKKIAILIILASLPAIVFGSQKRFYTEKPGPDVFEEMTPSAATEVALVEEVLAKRLAYRQELEKLKSFYEQTGNQLKLEWVEREFKSIDSAPRYKYIIEAEVAGDKLIAKDSIPRATVLYNEAVELYNRAYLFPVFTNTRKLRLALNKFNELIKEYPTSDKIDDAAYMAGKIHEHFKDYSIAVLYYKRTFQWNPETSYPARYRAARLLDYQLFERDEALKLYRESLEKEKAYYSNAEEIQLRIEQLTAGAENVKIE
jgi:tetratricopeptide (TPR) repeat protein